MLGDLKAVQCKYKSKHISKVMAKVLPKPYSFKKARNMLKEIVDHMVRAN